MAGPARTMVARVVAVAVAAVALTLTAPAGAESPAVTEYPREVGGSIAAGPDGRVWYPDAGGLRAIATDGSSTLYPLAGPVSALAAGPDGHLWAATPWAATPAIVRVSTAGDAVTHLLPPINAPEDEGWVQNATAVTAGPDGNIWYTRGTRTIGKMTTSGAVTEYTIPGPTEPRPSPTSIAAGVDGALWFAAPGTGRIGRVTTDGTFTFSPTGEDMSARSVAAGPDGNVWFTDYAGRALGRITPSWEITRIPLPPPQGTQPVNSWPSVVVAGPDGNVWAGGERALWRVTVDGSATAFSIGEYRTVTGMTAGPDGRVWYGVHENITTRSTIAAITTGPDPTGEFTSLTPARILDSRSGTGRSGAARPLGPQETAAVQITGRGGVPVSGVSAVVMNVTAVGPSVASYLTVSPTGEARPEVSNLNFVPGQTVPNLVTVAVGAGGRIDLYNAAGAVDVIFDVGGFYADSGGPFGSRYRPVPASRLFDTRSGQGGVAPAAVGAGAVLPVQVTGRAGVPATGVTGVVMNITATQPSAGGFLTIHPADVARPDASSLNFTPGLTVANLVTVRVPSSGVVDIFNAAGTTHVLADVVGYYTTGVATNEGRFVPVSPARLADSRILFGGAIRYPFSRRISVDVAGRFGVPRRSVEVGTAVLNVTAVDASGPGWFTVGPDDQYGVEVSSLNYGARQTVPNLVLTTVSASGPSSYDGGGLIAVDPWGGEAHVLVDVFGYFTGPDFIDRPRG